MPANIPLDLKVLTADRVDLGWTATPGAVEYHVYRAVSPARAQARGEDLVTVTRRPAHADRELAPDVSYGYLVESLDAAGKVVARATGQARTRPAGLWVERTGGEMLVRGDAFEITWSSAAGGEITRIRQYDGDSWLDVLARDRTAPGLELTDRAGRVHRARELRGVELRVEKQTPSELQFATSIELAGVRIGARYHLFSEGVLFCEWALPDTKVDGHHTQGVDAEANQRLLATVSGRLALELNPDILNGKFAWGHFARQFGGAQVWKGRTESVADADRMMPIAMADYGVNPTGGFTNHVEFFIEDSPAQGAWSRFGDDGRGGFKFEMGFDGRAMRNLYFLPWDMGFLNTRWGLCLGAARRGPLGRALPGRRNNLTGARIFHSSCGGQSVGRELSDRWPFNVPPVNLITDVYRGCPPDEDIDRAQRQGANVILLHQSWMRSGGSNCEPPADYIPRDPVDLKRFVESCHKRGIRVGLYMRGVEKHALFQPYFEQFMQRGVDGLYVDWSSPYAMGHQGCSDLHFSAYNYFLFTRALRERVGEGGFLIAHSGGVPTMIAFAVFDAYLPGEYRTQRDNFTNSVDEALHLAFASCIGVNPIGGRKFHTPRAVAFSAGLGFNPHVSLPRYHGWEWRHHMEGLWRIRASVPMERAVMYNGCTENFRPVAAPEGFLCTLYKIDRNLALLVAANLGPKAAAELRIDTAALGLPGAYRVTELRGARQEDFSDRGLPAIADGVIRTDEFETNEFRGYRLERQADPQ
jgi:hypothetical protein